MTNIYTVTILDPENKLTYNFTSLDALFTYLGQDRIGVSKKYLYTYFGKNARYKNRLVIIDKFAAYNISDVKEGIVKPR